MASLSQASRLEDLPSSHDALQGHATHIIEWSMMLRPKDSGGTCIPRGVTTFLQAGSRRYRRSDYYAPSDTSGMHRHVIYISTSHFVTLISSCSSLPTSTFLCTLPEVSRVPHRRLMRDGVCGVFCVPLPLFVAPSSWHRVESGLPVFPRTQACDLHECGPYSYTHPI